MPMRDNRAQVRRDFAGCIVIWVVVLMVDFTGIDFMLTALYGTSNGFAWRDHWLTSGVAHRGGRVVSWLLFAAVVMTLWKPWPAAARVSQRTRVWWLACTVLCLILIPTLKHFSLTSCPWDLREFGGSAKWVSHWAWAVADGGPGRCFPSGHASGAFGFVAGYFALRDTAPRHARAWLIALLLLGAIFGWAQLMRGAHHFSHALWTAAICWTVTAVTFHVTQRWRSAGA